MPPAMHRQAGTPCCRSQFTTFKLRTLWWQKTINLVSPALAFSCCKLAGMFRMGINVAPSMRVMANSSGSRTSIRFDYMAGGLTARIIVENPVSH